jgi:flagellum-specific peptidoglycan hydrolase FlgJ
MKEWIKDIIAILAISILVLFIGISSTYRIKFENKIELTKDSIIDCNYYFQKHRIRFSHIVYAQAILESDNFKSNLYKNNNNLFGMKVPAQRFTFCINPFDYGNYSKYESIEYCILDYKAWQMQNAYNIYTEEGYFNLLSNIYAEDKNYINKLKKIRNENKSRNN